MHAALRCCWLSAIALAARPAPTSAEPPRTREARTPAGIVRVAPDVEVLEVAPGVWRFVTSIDLPRYGRTPANGLLVESGGEALVVNTGWSSELATQLADWAERAFKVKITAVVPTHAHADTMGGLAAFHRRGADSWAQERTLAIARAMGQETPHHVFDRVQELSVGGRVVRLASHGAGHTSDNIVAWLPAERILFGGCLVKSASSTDLGNIEDADLTAWPATMEALMAAYPNPRLVIPGHGDPGDAGLLQHTLQLARAARRLVK